MNKHSQEYNFGKYELPQFYKNYQIILYDDLAKRPVVFSTNSLILSENCDFFIMLFKNNFSEVNSNHSNMTNSHLKGKNHDSKASQVKKTRNRHNLLLNCDFVELYSDVVSINALSILLKWMHSQFLTKISTVATKANRMGKFEDVFECISSTNSDFDIVWLIKTARFLMIKQQFYEDLEQIIVDNLSTVNALDIYVGVHIADYLFEGANKSLLVKVSQFFKENLLDLYGIDEFVEDFSTQDILVKCSVMEKLGVLPIIKTDYNRKRKRVVNCESSEFESLSDSLDSFHLCSHIDEFKEQSNETILTTTRPSDSLNMKLFNADISSKILEDLLKASRYIDLGTSVNSEYGENISQDQRYLNYIMKIFKLDTIFE